MPRSTSARLAVLLIAIPIVLALRSPARADDGCVTTPAGIECSYRGSTSTQVVTALPPLRYLATMAHPAIGPCWYWSRHPPGLDSSDPAHDHAIILTRLALPECPEVEGETVVDTASLAWEVFRSWPLAEPEARLRPTVGITNLPTVLAAPRPSSLAHMEVLPDGRPLHVEATVAAVIVDWGDGSPPVSHPATSFFSGGATHPFRLKTCPPAYRAEHPSGGNCHPALEAYPVVVSFDWQGRYHDGGPWIVLGTIRRSTSIDYDVDEVVGIPVRP
jgi:hypothetical protein